MVADLKNKKFSCDITKSVKKWENAQSAFLKNMWILFLKICNNSILWLNITHHLKRQRRFWYFFRGFFLSFCTFKLFANLDVVQKVRWNFLKNIF